MSLTSSSNTHYNLEGLGIQVIDIIRERLSPDEFRGWLKGNLIKYTLREKGQDFADLEKMVDYAKMLQFELVTNGD